MPVGTAISQEDAEKAGPGGSAQKGPLEIKDRLFIAQVNDVYLNPEDYLGRRVTFEGIFKVEPYAGKTACFVLRNGPGCCGTDGNVGFEVAWDATDRPYPAQDAWVRAEGVFRLYNENGYEYLCVALDGLSVLEKRGTEYVSQ